MNRHVTLNDNEVLCGSVRGYDCICLRQPGHWGPHIFKEVTNRYRVLQVAFCQISFEIPEAVADKAMADKDWTWSE